VPRYLKGIQVRLQRLPNDPAKDVQKATQVRPFWDTFLARQISLRATDPEGAEEFRWLLEELRISVFAPELKTAVPVSTKRVEDVWRSLG
jgi:ATP-dependent helicase HrpA